MKTRAVVLLCIAVLVGLGVWWFRANFERKPTEDWVGPSREARLRQFLAAERFAERMGLEVGEVRSLPELDALPAQGVLLLPNRRQALPPARIESLVQWVERGGHLIAEAEFLGVPDPLLDQLGVKRSQAETLRQPFTIELQGGRKLTAFFPDQIKLDAVGAHAGVRAGGKMVTLARGRGLVTAASSLRFARNPGYDDQLAKLSKRPPASIGAHDHAELFWHLLSLAPGGELQVYFRPERLSLWRFLADNAAPVLAASGLLLALWLWSIVPRFGPVTPDAPPGRRRLLDHLRASGRYYWTKGLRAKLVVAARDAALRRIARAQPDFATAPQAERAARLALLTRTSKQEAERFIAAGGPMRGAEFIKLAQHAQRVHSALEKGTK
jgi:hypothetical protein